jgi:hypothetical protein
LAIATTASRATNNIKYSNSNVAEYQQNQLNERYKISGEDTFGAFKNCGHRELLEQSINSRGSLSVVQISRVVDFVGISVCAYDLWRKTTDQAKTATNKRGRFITTPQAHLLIVRSQEKWISMVSISFSWLCATS